MGKRATSSRRKKPVIPSFTDDTPPVEIPRPNGHREDRLPIHSVGSAKFEELCRDILKHAHSQITRRTLKRTSGQRQFGVDVEGFNTDHESEVVVSCKCYREVEPGHLVPWTEDFIKHLDGHWKNKGVKVFILAVTHPGNSDDLTDAIRACRDLLKPHGIRFELWDMLDITDLLRKEPPLVDRYFNRAWHDAISPHVSPADGLSQENKPSVSGQSAAVVALAQEIAALTSERNAWVGQRIEDANSEYRAGRTSRLVACLDELQSDARWASLDAAIRARVIRSRAMLALNADDVIAAGKLLDEADAIAPPPDRSTRAWYVRATEGPDKAKTYLLSPVTAREIEVLATLQIETGKATDAIAELDRAEKPATPEQFRLRALAQCLMGERELAVTTAALACGGPTPSMAAVQSHAIVHIMAALAPRADVQLGAVPNPFSSALVRVTPDAVAHLDQAIDILSRQIPLVDPQLAGDLELWKLAALLLHPTRTRDARMFADDMLNRATVDPLTVAWCHSSGMRLKYGRIRKTFEDALRAATGTPSHVIVLAMLEAERRSASSAAELIARHRPAFPDDDAFLLGWQKRFEGDPGEDPFAAVMHKAERKDYAPLVAYLAAHDTSANQVLAAAGLLAIRKQWQALNSLRDKLVPVGTPRAIDLAARAALEAGASSDAVAILDAAKSVFPHGQLTESLLYLRARAHDQQGNKGAAIDDLRAVAKTSRDPSVASQLIHSLISIGRLKEARRHAQSYVKLPSAKPLELVQFAEIFKHVDADFSRSLIKRAADDPKLPPYAVGGVMALANTLGLAEIEGRMMQLIGEITKDGSAAGIIRYDNIEDVIAFMKERGEALQQEYNVWQVGMSPGHAVLDVKTFAALYLADPLDRKDALYKALPMLVRAANAEPRTIAGASGAKPSLIVDISALLLAMRCDLIGPLERAYNIQIPEAVPFALLSIESEWPQYDDAFVQTAEAWLSDSQTAVRTVATLPPEAVPIGTEQPPFELIPERVTAACERARATGELSQAVATGFLSGVCNETVAAADPVSALTIEPWSLVRLAQAGVLEPIAKSMPLYLLSKDRNELIDTIAMAKRQIEMRRKITALRELVGDRLAKSAWTTLPRPSSVPGEKRSKASPHLRSLLEIMDAVNAGTDVTIWVEDRTFSRTRLPALVNITDVTGDLLKRGVIDAVRHTAIDQMLRQMGYAFLPVPVDAIAHDVQRASIVDGSLIETPELARWRSWYAQEVGRLAFANQAPEPDKDGRITGEPRHLLQMMAMARDVLARIWSGTTSDEAQKYARSDWVWTCLRFETTPALQWSVQSEEAQRLLMATVLFHTADLPLLAMLNSDGLPKEAHQPYIDWFIQNVLDARCTVDPLLADNFARQLASLLVPHIERDPADTDQTARSAQNYMKLTVSRYLDLFPEKWRDRILSHCDLAKKLGVTSIMTLDVGDVAIPADVIEAAMSEIAGKVTTDSPVTINLPPQNGVVAALTLKREATGHLAAHIAVGSQTAHLEPFLVAVTLQHEAERLKALEAVPAALDMPSAQLASTIREIASLPTLTERVEKQKEAFDLEFVRLLDRVRDQLLNRQSIEFSDLSLPAPEAIAQYVRLSDPYRSDPAAWLDEMTTALSADHGLEKAARRIGAIPLDLPDAFLARLADVAVDLNQISSAAHARLYFKAWNGRTDREQDRRKLIGIFAERLDTQAAIMAALIWKGSRQIRRSASWRRLHPQIAFTLLWVWADRLASSIASAGVDTEKAAKIIRRSEPADISYIFCVAEYPACYEEHAFFVDEARIVASIVAHVMPLLDFKSLPPELRQRLLSKIGTEVNGVWCPKIETSFPVPVDPALWITRDIVSAVITTDAVQVPKPFSERDADHYVLALMADPVSPQNAFLVPGLLAGAHLRAISAETAKALIIYLDKLLVDFASAHDTLSFRHAQCIRAALLGKLGDGAELEASLDSMARAFQAKHGHQKTGYVIDPSRSGIHRDLAQLIEVVMAYAKELPGTPSAKVVAMAGLITRIPETWPGARQGLIELLDRSVNMLDSNLAAAVWPWLLKLRQAA